MAKDILQNFSNVFVFRVINIVFIQEEMQNGDYDKWM